MAKNSSASGEQPQSVPQIEPQELHPTNNIRFVMFEVAKLVERVDHLTKAIEKLPASMEKATDKISADAKERHVELKSEHKDTRDRVITIESKVAFVKGAVWVGGGLFAVCMVVLGVLTKYALDKI